MQWQNDQHELLKKDQLPREDQLQSDLLQREELLQERDQLHEKQREQLQKDEDKILNRLSLLASDNL